MDTKKITKFLIITFASSWIVQLIGILSKNGYVYSACIGLICLLPIFAVKFTAGGIINAKSKIGWGFDVGKHWRWFVASWIFPIVVVALCCAVFFLIFPDKFDVNCGYYGSLIPEGSDMKNINPRDFVIIELISSWFFGSFLNIFFYFGQEAGFRAYLVPLFAEKFGYKKSVLISGLIYGLYRLPVIAFAGYEYGDKYPALAPLVNIVYAVGISIFLSYIYAKSNSVWFSALALGTVKSLSSGAIYFLKEEPTSTLLGPTIMGLLPALMLLLLGVLLIAFADFTPYDEEEEKRWQNPFGRIR